MLNIQKSRDGSIDKKKMLKGKHYFNNLHKTKLKENKYVSNSCEHLQRKTLLIILKCAERDAKLACQPRNVFFSIYCDLK
jgi:hypothetical protein